MKFRKAALGLDQVYAVHGQAGFDSVNTKRSMWG